MDLSNLNNGSWDLGKDPLSTTFSYNLTAPGLPTEVMISAIALLLMAYGVRHDIPYDPNFNTESVNTGNAAVDNRFQNDYMMFKMWLDGISRDYSDIHCVMAANYTTAHMTFTCS